MGERYTFVCGKCKYEAVVSGGSDGGWHIQTDTYVCKKCNDVVDSVIGASTKDPSFKLAKKDLFKCPKCSNPVSQKWDSKKCECPKCKGKMEKKEGWGTVMQWD
jgi:hypothetical protein